MSLLADLQERFPLGSRWYDPGTIFEATVIGYGGGELPIFVEYPDGALARRSVEDAVRWTRIPEPPPPCPITEPVKLYRGPDYYSRGWAQEPLGCMYPSVTEPQRITIHPEGAEPPEPRAYWTWEQP